MRIEDIRKLSRKRVPIRVSGVLFWFDRENTSWGRYFFDECLVNNTNYALILDGEEYTCSVEDVFSTRKAHPSYLDYSLCMSRNESDMIMAVQGLSECVSTSCRNNLEQLTAMVNKNNQIILSLSGMDLSSIEDLIR